ncbi:MAG: ABC transporter ATP-binding protein [Solobacterium sp.]|nr:ABC transporter ATP-binding protein [Solobacterium sp.]
MEDKKVLLDIRNLTVQYKTRKGTVEAVNNIDLCVNKGETIGLVGETGAGKTTTALAIMGLLPVPPAVIPNGEIFFDGEDLLLKPEKEMRKIRGGKISMIYQDPMTALNPIMTVGDQIVEMIVLHDRCSAAEAQTKACEILEMVGIPAVRFSEYPHQFSGGMKQRVVIAIALACNPSLLIADEPTTALDVTVQAQVMEMMNKLKRELDTAMILITHDLGIVAEICDKVAIMYAGEIIEYGTAEDIFDNHRHPYTEGLFGSIPNLEEDQDRLSPIPGLMPDPTTLPEGCNFAERCPYAKPECSRGAVMTSRLSKTHVCRCIMAEKEV